MDESSFSSDIDSSCDTESLENAIMTCLETENAKTQEQVQQKAELNSKLQTASQHDDNPTQSENINIGLMDAQNGVGDSQPEKQEVQQLSTIEKEQLIKQQQEEQIPGFLQPSAELLENFRSIINYPYQVIDRETSAPKDAQQLVVAAEEIQEPTSVAEEIQEISNEQSHNIDVEVEHLQQERQKEEGNQQLLADNITYDIQDLVSSQSEFQKQNEPKQQKIPQYEVQLSQIQKLRENFAVQYYQELLFNDFDELKLRLQRQAKDYVAKTRSARKIQASQQQCQEYQQLCDSVYQAFKEACCVIRKLPQ